MPLDAYRTADGGARQGPADLWCTYAAVRTLTWLGAAPADPEATAAFLRGRQNADGAFAWQKGLPSDVWATYYCTQALSDLGGEIPRRGELADWLARTQHPTGGFAMTPGQRPDVWATYYATRLWDEILRRPVPGPRALRRWLAGLQREDGALGWYPGAPDSDVRACYYGALAWRAAFADRAVPWRRTDLLGWLGERQRPDGGYVFDTASTASCLWATFRAVRALDALGARPARAADCARWISARQTATASFTRWEGYPDPDVWAAFSAVGAAQTLGHPLPDAAPVLAFLKECELPEGGFTYRRVEAAGDSLATSALLLVDAAAGGADTPRARERARWLHAAHLPYEGGVMYMPGRGAEIRCTLWAVGALAAAGRPALDGDRIAAWLRRLQNRDGGFGYWHGRASDMVATVSALEILAGLGRRPQEVLDATRLADFVEACRGAGGYGQVPGAAPTCAATAQALRARHLLGERDEARRLAADTLPGYASRLGGYTAGRRGVPDLVSTYQAVLTRQVLELPVDTADLGRLLDRLRPDGEGYAWSPLGRRSGGPLATALGTLLNGPDPLVPLNL
ncbi:prenyltransferase/squalene oxidase repeat-containing protein [Allostreptomyces psammosilenae]|uniref:Geranylgeranyl transferase type II subunit beta n=1 Tax=Allostreptomyces psammosilenae TaxID=1892865 RepID=A0A852ZX59_9ACTN|nr:prenyltransferase/squalene oxidase repeat-containing protein [Allostreptomyces psammosilenae]NYI06946.1 hypothetical protein [Allostreptomyces psammosilenae]